MPMLQPEERSQLRTTSRGLGETLLAALDGCRTQKPCLVSMETGTAFFLQG
ncbi:hypothetical protein [Paenibacillus sp. P22]|uniref:hypothetical protein n=1 Tax=Paenibacillus sp. P22 TaxID=483908 RepID=UPI00038F4DD0|nr:hypothetical protein [Paenibacillus sp. P22]CDN42892.1 hypothetical protein BN871_CA_00040 [Paenibacillus sp. P22]